MKEQDEDEGAKQKRRSTKKKMEQEEDEGAKRK